VINVPTGELGAGKTTTGYIIGKWFDPLMSPDRVVYYGSDYMDVVRKISREAKHPYRSCAQVEEPNLNLGARDFAKTVNKRVAGFTQATRSLGVNTTFPLPAEILMDCNILRVAQIKTRITGRNDDWAWGVVHRIKPNEFGTSPRYFYPKLGTIKIKNPYKDKRLCEELRIIEENKQKFLGEFFVSDDVRKEEQKDRKPKEQTEFDHLGYVLEHPEEFLNPKNPRELSYSRIQAGPNGTWNMGSTKASRIRNVAQLRLKTFLEGGGDQGEVIEVKPAEDPPEANLGD